MTDDLNVKFFVEGLPPCRRIPANVREGIELKDRRERLKKAAKEAYGRTFPFGDEVVLVVRYSRRLGTDEGVSIIGGVADGLRSVLYTDDGLVTELQYREEVGEREGYWVEVRNRFQISAHDHDHDHDHPHA